MVLLQSEILLRIAKTGIYTVGERQWGLARHL